MRIAIIGAGPTGLFTAVSLARRGHQAVVIDRDPGPPRPDGWWQRNGVMQFHHPHAFRLPVIEALHVEIPEMWNALLAAGAVPVPVPGHPERVVALRCRRLTFERLLRRVAEAEPGVTLLHAHADEVVQHRGRAMGVRVRGFSIDADLVLDASGRASRLTRTLRGSAKGGDCGLAYVSRQYQLRVGAEEGPTNALPGLIVGYAGYLIIVFPHDQRTFSALIARASSDRELMGLRHEAAFEAATQAIPGMAVWTESDRSDPITDVLLGGHLYNSYRGQLDQYGRIPLPGLISLGDSVCTTNPSLGRGISTSLMQARQLLRLLDASGSDLESCALAFDEWCAQQIKPWFEDHVYMDADLQRRWDGGDVDFSRRLPSDLVVAAAEGRPDLTQAVSPYLAMLAPPSSLDALQPQAREIYASGWRPPLPDGPTRDELAAIVAETIDREQMSA